MAGYIGTQAVSVNTTSATISDDLTVGDDATIAGDATVTGVITGSTVEATGDTAAGDNAAMGYTAAEGLILTGQGSTSDITLKNDADATVFTVPTGTDDILFPDNAKAMFGASSDLQIYHDGSNSYVKDQGDGQLRIDTNGTDVRITKTDSEYMATFGIDGAVTLYYNNASKLATTATGVAITGGVAIGGTGAANTLDDYEEGAVSLTMAGSNDQPNTTVNVTGTYVKIGRLVSVRAQNLNLNNTGASGPMQFTGFPFAANGAYGIGSIGEVNDICTFTNTPFLVVSGTVGYVFENITQANAAAVSHHVDAAGAINIDVTYETNS